MGGNQSTIGYSRLRHPSTDSLRKPLLGLDHQQKMVVEKGQNCDKNAPLHKEVVKETKSRTPTLETDSQSPSSKATIPKPHKEQKTEANPEKEVKVLWLRIAKLEKKQEEMPEISKKIAALETSVLKLTSTINEIKRPTEPRIRESIPNLIDLDPVPVTMETNNGVIVAVTGEEIEAKNPTNENTLIMPDREFQAADQGNELVGCLVVVIFLLGIVLGLNCN